MNTGLRVVLCVSLGSVLGGLARYGTTAAFVHWKIAPTFWATLVVNAVGCFLIGLFSVWSAGRWADSAELRALWITGFCGALTTFSTFAWDTVQLHAHRSPGSSVLYIVGSVVAGLLCFQWGTLFAKVL